MLGGSRRSGIREILRPRIDRIFTRRLPNPRVSSCAALDDMPESSPAADYLVSDILALIGREGSEGASLPGDLFATATKKQLLDCAARLGLKGVSKLSREDLAGRIEVAFAGLAGLPPIAPGDHDVVEASGATPPANGSGPPGGGSFPQKFDLGPTPEAEAMPKDIPWGYGNDRITAMAVDPARLYVYWEATDSAIAAARAGLGPAGERAWLNVRVYDITGRLFDGTNAHSYFDHRVERHERQWFFVIDKPTSTTCVELGLRSEEGYFVKVVRSGRVEFPRNEPVGGGGTEWLSVRGATGPVGSRWAGAPGSVGGAPAAGGPGPGDGGGAPGGGAPGPGGEWQDWNDHSGFPVPRGQRLFTRSWRQEISGERWTSDWARTEWLGPVMRTEWESGPFEYPVDVPEGSIEIQDNGEVSVRSEGGRTHVMYGPWQVVIRGIGARAERRVLGTWEYRRQVAVEGGVERFGMTGGGYAPGSSEWMMMGASERAWMGASELWLMGASETLLGGASERAFLGGSEFRFRGASERRLAGASELRLAGASERMFAGASETMFAGASERMMGGASERLLGGASERSGGGAGPVYEYDPASPYPAPPREPNRVGEPAGFARREPVAGGPGPSQGPGRK